MAQLPSDLEGASVCSSSLGSLLSPVAWEMAGVHPFGP